MMSAGDVLDMVDRAQTAQDALKALEGLAASATGPLQIDGNGLATLLALIGERLDGPVAGTYPPSNRNG